MKKEVLISRSEKETREIGRSFGSGFTGSEVVALFGEIGTGKTILTKGIAEGLDIPDEITSASFALLEIYQGRLELYHFDLYRIQNDLELEQLGFEEYWESKGISIIEWADRVLGRLPEKTIKITIDHVNENTRQLIIEYPDN